MAMRLFTREEFEDHLSSQLNLTKTDLHTATADIWQTQSGVSILVPNLDSQGIPDYLLDEIYQQIGKIESGN